MRKQPFSRQSEEKRDFVLKIAIVDGLSSVWVQYLALPCFGVLFKLIVDAESGMILFLYLFILAITASSKSFLLQLSSLKPFSL